MSDNSTAPPPANGVGLPWILRLPSGRSTGPKRSAKARASGVRRRHRAKLDSKITSSGVNSHSILAHARRPAFTPRQGRGLRAIKKVNASPKSFLGRLERERAND